MPLPVHVFEPRYQEMLRDCRDSGGRFGVVAIRAGEEVGGRAETEAIGTEAVITQLRELPRGRSQLLLTGGRRFRIRKLKGASPYPRAEVELVQEPEPDPAAFVLAHSAAAALRRYATSLAGITGRPPTTNRLPTEPMLLSWVVASTLIIDIRQKQRLLEQVSVGQRLRTELEMLKRESTLLDLQLANRLQIAPYGRN